MEGKTKFRTHPRHSQFGEGQGVTINRNSVKHAQWIYRCMRNEGLSPTDARMNLVHAFAAGQRDARATVETVLRGLG